MVFKPVTPPRDGNGLGVVQETIHDRASRGHVAQKFAPFLQRPVAGHDGGPVFISAHDYFKKRRDIQRLKEVNPSHAGPGIQPRKFPSLDGY
jgi:hypothetical protein